MNDERRETTNPDENEIARIAGHGRDVDGSAPRQVRAEVGAPAAEHSEYGLVREGSRQAQGLSEEQIRGVEPTPADLTVPSPGLQPQPGHIENPQQPLPGKPPAMPQPTPPETKPHPGF
jgi:hypothetical protein